MTVFLSALLLENPKVDDEEAVFDEGRFADSSQEAVVGVCWYCGAKLRDVYDRAPLCRECRGEEVEDGE